MDGEWKPKLVFISASRDRSLPPGECEKRDITLFNVLQKSSQIADAVAYLRSCNMVHGDIKGANILVSDEHIPKLADFGNSVLGEYTLTFTTTTTRPHMTVRWTAPEIFLEETKHTFEGDVYALGMTILEIFTGSAPYEGLLDVAVMRRLMLREQPERPQQHMPTGDELSDHLWDLLTSCWDSEPKKRPFAAVVRNKLKVMKKKRMPGVYCPRMSFSTHFTRVGLRYSTRPNEHFAVLLPKSLWKPDEMADGCDTLTCDAKFSLFERRHHCRRCGDVFCQACSSHQTLLLDTTNLPFFSPPEDISFAHGPPGPMVYSRVCDDCHALIYGLPASSYIASQSFLVF
ncbi:unnamed protein product [Rhizoctonia solani]|uniref:Uncharacterized protein n=1 Tax=Rhizoctonia solani TaxID=456999 RepID=A0A8H3CSW8_9AGAM|nr:unnamed protein product [Rhizoctonia solani]